MAHMQSFKAYELTKLLLANGAVDRQSLTEDK